jgi:pentatricopeptide repeat protein
MKQHKIITNSYTYKDILSWCKQQKNGTIARDLYNMGKSDILSEIILCNQIMSVFCNCGQTREALSVYQDMKTTKTRADNITYTILISSCIESNMLDDAQRLCEESDSVSLTTPLATTIIKVYCRVGNFDDAIKLYSKINLLQNTVPALVIINELTIASRYDEARTIVESLDHDIVRTSLELSSTIIKLYCRCNRIDLAMTLFHKLTPDAHVYNILISSLINAGKLDDAQQIVDSMHNHKFTRSVELTTTLIKLACKKNNFEHAITLFNKVSPTAHTYNVLVSALIDDQAYDMARKISDTIPKKIVQSSVALLTTLIKLECKTNNMKQAQKLFSNMTIPTEVTYTVMLSGYMEAEMYDEAEKLVATIKQQNQRYSLQLQVTLIALYLKTKRYESAAEVYDTVHKSELFEDPTTCAILLSLFTENLQHTHAEEIINAVDKYIIPNARLMSSLVHYECKRKNLDKAMTLFQDMRSQKLEPSAITYVIMLSTFVDAQRFSDVEKIASFMRQDNVNSSVELTNTLIKYEIKRNNLDKALDTFHTMSRQIKPTMVTYNILLSGCIEDRRYVYAQEICSLIQPEYLNVELYTTMIKLECRMNNVNKALILLKGMQERGIAPDAATYTVLINNLPVQHPIIDELVEKASNVILSSELCSAIIKVYFARTMEQEAFLFFKTFVWNTSVVTTDIIMQLFSCMYANQFAYDLKQAIDRKYYRAKIDNCVLMLCAAREYDVALVETIFQAIPNKDLDLFNCLLYAYKSTGKGDKAVELLRTMSVEPNNISYLMVLVACSHSKLAALARSIYDGLVAEHKVNDLLTNCMVDTYARVGDFEEAEKLIPRLKDSTIAWTAILGACKLYNNVALAEKATKLLEHDLSSYVMMGNIYASQGMWHEQRQIRSTMEARRFTKIQGMATIQIGQRFFSYIVEDSTATNEIAYLKQLREAITLIGYEPNISCVVKELPSYQAKVEHLWQHCEKLALAAGLLYTPTKINITKNLRMCLDCHEAIKLVSQVTQREIVIWDAIRGHQFINGKCDCGDTY